MKVAELLKEEYRRVLDLSTLLAQQGLVDRSVYRKGEAGRLRAILDLLKQETDT